MSSCGNCGLKLGCSCQKRAASDGKSCCTSCLIGYEAMLNNQKTELQHQAVVQQPIGDNNSTAPVITEIKYNQFND